nr:hypothetical protein [Tanacetum cinerariifolium]
SGRIVPLFDTMLIQQGEGLGTPTEPHHTPSQEAQPSSHTHISLPSIPTVTSVPIIPIPTVISSETTPIRQYIQRARIAQGGSSREASDDTEDMATVLTTMDATTVLAGRAAEVPTGSGSIPTTGPSAAEVPTGSDVVPTA